MKLDRKILRNQAKKEWKKLIKASPKANIPFSGFFEYYKKEQRLKSISGELKTLADSISSTEAELLSSMIATDLSVQDPISGEELVIPVQEVA